MIGTDCVFFNETKGPAALPSLALAIQGAGRFINITSFTAAGGLMRLRRQQSSYFLPHRQAFSARLGIP